MNRDRICAGFDKTRHVMVSVLNHEMDIERKTRQAANNPDNLRPKGNVIDEMSVHYVAMNPICGCRFNTMNFVAESREISGKNGWGDDDSLHQTNKIRMSNGLTTKIGTLC